MASVLRRAGYAAAIVAAAIAGFSVLAMVAARCRTQVQRRLRVPDHLERVLGQGDDQMRHGKVQPR